MVVLRSKLVLFPFRFWNLLCFVFLIIFFYDVGIKQRMERSVKSKSRVPKNPLVCFDDDNEQVINLLCK